MSWASVELELTVGDTEVHCATEQGDEGDANQDPHSHLYSLRALN